MLSSLAESYLTSVTLVNGAVAYPLTETLSRSEGLRITWRLMVIPTHHSRATDGLFSAPRYRTSTTLLEVLVVLPTAWIRTRVHPLYKLLHRGDPFSLTGEGLHHQRHPRWWSVDQQMLEQLLMLMGSANVGTISGTN